MPKKTKTGKRPTKAPNGPQRPGRFILAAEPGRLATWRAEAAKHNVSLATWVRWSCDAMLAIAPDRAKRMAAGPTGEVRDDGVQL